MIKELTVWKNGEVIGQASRIPELHVNDYNDEFQLALWYDGMKSAYFYCDEFNYVVEI